jgi:hypothetical protein
MVGLLTFEGDHGASCPPDQEHRQNQQPWNAGFEGELDIVAVDVIDEGAINCLRVFVARIDVNERP